MALILRQLQMAEHDEAVPVDSVTNYKGRCDKLERNRKNIAELMTAKEASMLKDYMSSVTKYGTAASAMSGTSIQQQERPEQQSTVRIRTKTTPGLSVCRTWMIRILLSAL